MALGRGLAESREFAPTTVGGVRSKAEEGGGPPRGCAPGLSETFSNR
jgi:hypothetical protein